MLTNEIATKARAMIFAYMPKSIPFSLKEDVVQEVLIDMMKSGRTFVTRRYVFWRWVDYVRRSLGRDYKNRPEHKKRKSATTISIETIREHFDRGEHEDFRIHFWYKDRSFNEVDQKDEVEYVLQGLKQRDKDILVMYYVEGLLLKEIAEVVGLSEGGVCWVLTKLKKYLQQEFGDRKELWNEPSHTMRVVS